MNREKAFVLGLSTILLINHPAWPTSDVPVNIEGINQTMVDLLRQMKIMQQELKQLRGEIEVHSYLLENLKNRQSESNYSDPEQNNVVVTTPKPPSPVSPPISPAPRSVVINPDAIHPAEQGAYDNAFSLLRSGGYEDAVKGFRDFLEQYPQSSLAPNSQYWIGESYYVTRRFREAQAEFQLMIDNYPNAAKTPDALLKIGYIQHELNQSNEARASLESVIERFPQSTAAKLASSRLEKMKR